MDKALTHIRSTGTFPVSCYKSENMCFNVDSLPVGQSFVDSKEDQNSVGTCPVSSDKIDSLKAKVADWLQPGAPGHKIFESQGLHLCLFDGFLLYCKEMQSSMSLIDIKLFLTVSRAKATQRREARDGYVTLEGFWKDPPGYVDAIVWPNYEEAHQWLFKEGDVQGQLDQDVLQQADILAQVGVGIDVEMERTLEWAVDSVIVELERRFSFANL